MSFTTLPEIVWECGDTIVDTRDNQKYATVQIGTQCWMAQNLNTGNRIASTSEQTNNATIEKYCYNNDPENCSVFGGLYQCNEMMQYSSTPGVQGICPTNWHLPTDVEWTSLTTYLGGESVAGGKMKETGLAHWQSPNAGATNSSGFSALPGGSYGGGSFYRLGSNGYWWSSTVSTSSAWAGAWTTVTVKWAGATAAIRQTGSLSAASGIRLFDYFTI